MPEAPRNQEVSPVARMQIASPLLRAAEVMPLVDAGADEFYCGYLPAEWRNRYTALVPLNRRDTSCSFTSGDDLAKAIEITHRAGRAIFLTLNGLYVADQYDLLDALIEGFGRRVDGLIIADLGLLMHLRACGFDGKIHISTGGTCFNSGAVRLYEQLGASRIVMPRELLMGELLSMCGQNPQTELEVFALGSACPNIDGFCTLDHADPVRLDRRVLRGTEHVTESYDPFYTGPLCSVDYACSRVGQAGRGATHVKWPQRRVQTACAACALFELADTPVRYLKIVGRGLPLQHKLTYVRYVHAVVEILDQEHDYEAYVSKVKAIRDLMLDSACTCYYPSEWTKAGCQPK